MLRIRLKAAVVLPAPLQLARRKGVFMRLAKSCTLLACFQKEDLEVLSILLSFQLL
jgi:hypothetical protein